MGLAISRFAAAAVPQMLLYYAGGALAQSSAANSAPSTVASAGLSSSSAGYIAALPLLSLGNLGGAVPVCASAFAGPPGAAPKPIGACFIGRGCTTE